MDHWSFPHFDAITVSIADAPRLDEIIVVMVIADGETGTAEQSLRGGADQ
jgi:hypothetical protein